MKEVHRFQQLRIGVHAGLAFGASGQNGQAPTEHLFHRHDAHRHFFREEGRQAGTQREMPSFVQTHVIRVEEHADHAGVSVVRRRWSSSRNSAKSGSVAERPNASSHGLPGSLPETVTWITLAVASQCPRASVTWAMASASVAATTLTSGMPNGWATY